MKKPLPQRIFVTGIDTDVGKTVVSAALTEALHADYWKPIQAGYDTGTDRETVQSLLTTMHLTVHPEAYKLKVPAVPVHSAEQEGIEIDPQQIHLPQTANRLIIEGAGGLMVHLNRSFLVIDLIQQLGVPVILVSENYLGSINHTLLSIEALRSRHIEIAGIIYNGEHSAHMRDLIYQTSGVHEIGSVEKGHTIDKDFIQQQAAKLRTDISKYYTL